MRRHNISNYFRSFSQDPSLNCVQLVYLRLMGTVGIVTVSKVILMDSVAIEQFIFSFSLLMVLSVCLCIKQAIQRFLFVVILCSI
jgi:hypothetical protein